MVGNDYVSMSKNQVFVVMSEKNGYKNFDGVFSTGENANRYITTAMKRWNRGKEAGFSYYILKTSVE